MAGFIKAEVVNVGDLLSSGGWKDVGLKGKVRLEGKKISLQISDNAKDFLVNSGYNPLFGARPLKRAIQRHLEDPLAMEILEGRFIEGSKVEVVIKDGALTFNSN